MKISKLIFTWAEKYINFGAESHKHLKTHEIMRGNQFKNRNSLSQFVEYFI